MRSKKSMDVKDLAVRAGAIGLVVCAIAAAMLVAGREPAAKVQARRTTSGESATARKTPAMQVQRNSATSTPVAMESAAKSDEPTLVTITGCLERDADTYRLKDTAGADAPKSRSWKSGFLKKSAATIEVIDATNRLRLSNYVGRRVSVTGMLLDQEMQGRSLRRIAESCD
jgi:hypothetical protein